MADLTIASVKDDIVETVTSYLTATGEAELYESTLLELYVDALMDEYKVLRNYPSYFEAEAIEADVALYFDRKKSFFGMRVIPMLLGKIGGEGLSHLDDNSTSRIWDPEKHFADVIPYCEVM